MKIVYCANCGRALPILRKALPKYSRIIDIVEYHECLETVAEIELVPEPCPSYTQIRGRDKFVQNLDKLQPRGLGSIGTDTLRDRRSTEHIKDEAKSSAPINLIRSLRGQQ